MRHNIWKKYLKILCSWILILSICFLSLNVVVEASDTDSFYLKSCKMRLSILTSRKTN